MTVIKGYETEVGIGKVLGAYQAISMLYDDMKEVREKFTRCLVGMGYSNEGANEWAIDMLDLI